MPEVKWEELELHELREKLDSKEISSVELTKYFLARVKEQNPELNAFITITEEEALKQAQEADEYMAAGGGENPALCGIPFAAKDLFMTRGILTTAASKILENYIPPYDATVIEKLKEQRAVMVGKTNMDQFAHGSSGETSFYGPTKNPWDVTRMPGGSSSGSATAVAAGLAPWALATETGGSIRQPASLTGISGWKPTYGRVSRYGAAAMASSLDSMGAMARSVKDLAMIAEVLSGQDEKDSTTGPVEVPAYSKLLDASLAGVKVGVPKEYFVDGMEEGVEARVEEAIAVLKEQGAEIVEVSLPNTKYGSMVYAIVCPSEVSSNLARYDGIRYGHSTQAGKDLFEVYAKSRAEGFGDEAKRRIMTGTYVLSAGYYDAYYKKAQRVRRLIMDEFEEVFKQVDVLVAPSSPNVALPLGKAANDPLFGYIADQLNIPGSLAGTPGLSIPCGFAKPSDGGDKDMPVGLQIIGPQWGEQKVFNVGYAYQQVTDWHTKRPGV
ncbi:MAG TPA: Asp-tRNA(Asn)/Glu-tRNA(Gln) amidotransferase subunit GatA [Patescibacteria group bacterium]|jgi:aspartyl-tRNA(Asn)/glutamyl-tRNA(Gln) amidotransferase subunit A|nr:Asp-tRNA(Asn)/Glu-tRNA(Gln) amidotransferase subunit GatA [Patescibacteria group bacterium]